MTFIFLFSQENRRGIPSIVILVAWVVTPSFLSRKISFLNNIFLISDNQVFLLPVGMLVISCNSVVSPVTEDNVHLPDIIFFHSLMKNFI